MSLFKRKQSKDKDVGGNGTPGISTGEAGHHGSPPVSNQAQMGIMNGQPPRPPVYANGLPGAGQAGTPPMANGRRMTSNPSAPGQSHAINGPSSEMSPVVHQNQPGQAYHPALQQQQPRLPSGSSPVVNGSMPPPGAGGQNYPWSSPFPRYGLSVPAFPSHSGHMLIFGGLVHERVRNDLWSMDIRACETMPVKTKGDAPMPRVGHASAMADRIMIVWGGDTKVNVDDPQDEGLYILDLRSQEWTSVPIARGPVGRYGHAVCLVEGRFYVFGGQADGAFMNDLWMYDIKQLSGDKHKWEQIKYATPPPPRRTGHIFVAGNNGKLYLFGGTDGNYHYNDTWSFDLATNTWTELSCIGYIPLPREGHAAAIVDDTIYIFGGRDVKGKDLGDLAAFKLSNQRWYMFQNMGPRPTPRSGHAMVAASGKIFVVGGEANQAVSEARDDPNQIHILDTTKIKYPADSGPPRNIPTPSKATQPLPSSREGDAEVQGKEKNDAVETPKSLKQGLPHSGSMDSLAAAPSPPAYERMAQQQILPLGATLPRSGSGDVASSPAVTQTPVQPSAQATPRANGAPPQRPRREGDEEYRRAMSPPNGPASPTNSTHLHRVTSPISNGPASPPQNPKNGFNASILGTRSPSPRMRMSDADRPAPPPDAFYYGRSPSTNGFTGRPSSLSGASDLMRELKSKDAEVEAGRKREMALKVIIARAVQQGFVTGAEDGPDVQDQEHGTDEDKEKQLVHKLTDALVRLKHEKAAIQDELVSQTQAASDRSMEAERLRRGALQEAAFYRAKIATLESNSPIDLARIEKERIVELEKQIGVISHAHTSSQRELEAAQEAAEHARSLHSASSEREAETLKRAEEAEEAHRAASEEVEQLYQRAHTHEQTLRDHSERLITLSSTVQQREAERDRLQHQLDEAVTARDENLGLIEQAQAAISAAGLRTSEMEALYQKANGRVSALEEELLEVKAELEGKGREAELAEEKLREVENAWSQSREEADSLRAVTTSRLGEILDSHREMRADEGRHSRGHQEQLRALEEEGKSLRKMLNDAGQRMDAAEMGVSTHRSKARELEGKVQELRAELRASRTKLVSVQAEMAKYKDVQTSRNGELKEKELALADLETRCTVLRNLLAEHGIAVADSDLDHADVPVTSTRELEAQLKDRVRAHEASQREMEDLRVRCEEAEDKVESLGRLVERMKDARSPTAASMRSPTPTGEADRRVGELEKRLADIEKEHRDKIKAVEGDYQTAVRYVKGTEKMLKRMKDELNKQKATNSTLQTELDGLRGQPGSRTRDLSGRSTPSSIDGELSRKFTTLQNSHQKLQEDFAASQDVLTARNREVELLRMRVEDGERECETLREDLEQAKHRIQTLLEVGGVSDDDEAGSEEASMAFDKFTKELKQWERSRSPAGSADESTVHMPDTSSGGLTDDQDDEHEHGHGRALDRGHDHEHGHDRSPHGTPRGHRRNSSEYSGDWVQ